METRFCIGSNGGPRSSMWKLWTNKNKNDVYLTARDAGNSMHISFHESGRCHVKATRTLADVIRSVRSDSQPHLDVWDLKPDVHGRVPPAFQIFVPCSQLRSRPYLERRPVMWLPPPAEGHTAAVVLSLNEANNDPDTGGCGVLLRHDLPNNMRLALSLLHYRDNDSLSNMMYDILNACRDRAPHIVRKPGGDVDPIDCALLVFGVGDKDGSRYVIELAGDTIFSGNEGWLRSHG